MDHPKHSRSLRRDTSLSTKSGEQGRIPQRIDLQICRRNFQAIAGDLNLIRSTLILKPHENDPSM